MKNFHAPTLIPADFWSFVPSTNQLGCAYGSLHFHLLWASKLVATLEPCGTRRRQVVAYLPLSSMCVCVCIRVHAYGCTVHGSLECTRCWKKSSRPDLTKGILHLQSTNFPPSWCNPPSTGIFYILRLHTFMHSRKKSLGMLCSSVVMAILMSSFKREEFELSEKKIKLSLFGWVVRLSIVLVV